MPIFDGKTLDGWDGDPRLWSVRDGVIVGSTEGVALDDNSFLISRDKFSDFVLRAEVKLRNHNSGIQFRSEALPHWVVRGLQADMAEGNWWGSIYDEKSKRDTIVNGWKGKAEKVVRPNDWNQYEITCDGDFHPAQDEWPGNSRALRRVQAEWRDCAATARRNADAGGIQEHPD